MNRNLVNFLKFTKHSNIGRYFSKFCPNVSTNGANILWNNSKYIYNLNYFHYPIKYHIVSNNNYRYCQTSTLIKDSIETVEDAIKQFRLEHQIFVKNAPDGKNIFHFNELNMEEQLWKIMNNLNYTKPTPIQAQALPILFSGHDLIGKINFFF